MNAFVQLLQVAGVQVLLYAVVPAWALVRIQWRDAGEAWFAALVAGLGSAALLGRACDGRGIAVGTALGIWLAAWIIAGVAARWKRRAAAWPGVDGWLLAILALAWAVRIVHPLQTWALGQSDAYSHLGFMINVLETGHVRNGDYPPAYAWVMAFPAWLLRGHPYWVARFGGAVFGAGLALGVYALVSQIKSRPAGWAAAALVAGCPLFWLLQKTGVGSFANQFGLLLIPAALWAYGSGRMGWLALALAALAVAVPMMLVHALLLLGLIVLTQGGIRKTAGLFAMVALGGLAFVVVANQLSPERGMVVASLLMGNYDLANQAGATWFDVLKVVATDFLSVKRLGYGAWPLNAAALGLAGLFAAIWALGRRRGNLAWLLVGAWGSLTSLNVHLGLFQFTDYQREGWSFLLALACLGGLVFDRLRSWRADRRWRGFWTGGLAAAALAGLAFPPAHAVLAGPAESDLVQYLLMLDPGVTVLARRMSTFPSGQGDVIRTLHPRTVHEIDDLADADGPAIFLRDRPPAEPPISAVMRRLQPKQIAVMEEFCRDAEEENRRLEEELADRPARVEKITGHLDAWVLQEVRP